MENSTSTTLELASVQNKPVVDQSVNLSLLSMVLLIVLALKKVTLALSDVTKGKYILRFFISATTCDFQKCGNFYKCRLR